MLFSGIVTLLSENGLLVEDCCYAAVQMQRRCELDLLNPLLSSLLAAVADGSCSALPPGNALRRNIIRLPFFCVCNKTEKVPEKKNSLLALCPVHPSFRDICYSFPVHRLRISSRSAADTGQLIIFVLMHRNLSALH